MKLFVWNEPISVSYGSTCLYVVADDEEQAREIAQHALVSKYGSHPEGRPGIDVPSFDKPLGIPTRVIEAPCGEIYYWEE
jgi:hypothetical protein